MAIDGATLCCLVYADNQISVSLTSNMVNFRWRWTSLQRGRSCQRVEVHLREERTATANVMWTSKLDRYLLAKNRARCHGGGLYSVGCYR